MKRLGLFVLGGLLSLSMVGLASTPKHSVHAEGVAAEASAELVKMVNPHEINGREVRVQDNGGIDYPWEYLINTKYPGTETIVQDMAYLEFQFYNDETFVEGKEYASYMTDKPSILQPSVIIDTLKKANYPEESDVGVAIRYIAKEGSGYTNSDFYVQEGLRHTYHIDYVDESLYDVYAFGDANGWAMEERYHFVYQENTHMYSLESEFSGLVKMFVLEKGTSFTENRKEGNFQIALDKKETCRIEFSFRHPTEEGFIENNFTEDSLNGWIRFTKLSLIEEGENPVSENLLSNKLVYSSELPNDRKCYTDGKSDAGAQMTSKDVKAWYMWDLGETFPLHELRIWWEASCADKYDIYLADTVAHPEDLEQYNNKVDLPEADWVKAASVVASKPNTTHDDRVILAKDIEARYILIQTTVASGNAAAYGYYLYEVEAFASLYDTSFVGAQYGTSVQGNAIRFIGKVKADPATFAHEVKMELSFTDGTVSYGPKAVEMTYFYKTLTTTLNGVTNARLTADEGYYFFSFTLTNVKDGTYTVSVLENGEVCGGATYSLANGALSRAA